MATVLTIGYERRELDGLVSTLVEHGVEIVVDVRENAVSRKRGFSKRQLSEALDAAEIGYRNEPTLGNPRENREALRAGDPDARQRYLERLHGDGRDALDAVSELARQSTIALLCYERNHTTCHRTCIAETLTAEMPALEIIDL